jgi:hypothetical protein
LCDFCTSERGNDIKPSDLFDDYDADPKYERLRVLHTRNLCDFCTSERGNDIKPSDLFDDYDADPKYERLRSLIEHLREQYGDWKTQGAPRWVFDKMLAHPTKERRTSFDYTRSLNRVLPVLNDIIGEMETLRGHRFAVLSTQPAQP